MRLEYVVCEVDGLVFHSVNYFCVYLSVPYRAVPQQFGHRVDVRAESQHHGGESMPACVVGQVFADSRRLRPFPEVLVHIAEIDKGVEHMAVRICVLPVRHPFQRLLRDRDVDRRVGLLHYNRDKGLPVRGGDVAPFQLFHVADAQPRKTGEHICLLYKGVGTRSLGHLLYLLYCQVFAPALRLLDLLGCLKLIPGIFCNQAPAHGLVEHRAECLAICVGCPRAYGFAYPPMRIGVAEPVNHVETELPVNVRQPCLRSEHVQRPPYVAYAAEVSRPALLVVVAAGLQPVRKEHVRSRTVNHGIRLGIKKGFGALVQNIPGLSERPRVLPLCRNGGFRHKIELKELVLVPTVNAAV